MDVIELVDIELLGLSFFDVSDSEIGGSHFYFPVFIFLFALTDDSDIHYFVVSLVSVFFVVA